MKLIKQICPNCGAQISIDPGRGQAFCQYCGTRLLIDDESTTINVNQRIIDEARLKEAEVRLKELEYAHEAADSYNKEMRSWRTLILIYIVALAVGYLVSPTRGFVYILIFGAFAVIFLKPRSRYAHETMVYTSDKSRWAALLLCFFFGIFGVHYFYVGRVWMGVLYLFTFGFGGLGWLFDLIRILIGVFRDSSGRPLRQ